MNTDNIRELLNYIKSTKSYTAFSSIEFQPLIDLAERYLAVSAEMPEKKEKIEYDPETCSSNFDDQYSRGYDCGFVGGYNQAIEDATVAVTKMLLEQNINHATVTKCASFC